MARLRRVAPLLAGAAVGVAAAGAVALWSGGGEKRSATERFAPGQVAALRRLVPGALGHDCAQIPAGDADRHVGRDPAFASDPPALAVLSCRPTGGGAETLTAWRFASRRELDRRLGQWTRFLGFASGTCSDSDPGWTQWADPDGATRGSLLCANSGRNFVVWTDTRRRVIYEASSTEAMYALQSWWRVRVRRQADFPTPEERELFELAEKVISDADCVRDERAPSPLATASILCREPKNSSGAAIGADGVRLAHFETPAQLDEHFRAFSQHWGHGAAGQGEERCWDDAPFAQSAWYRGDSLKGRLICFPAWSEERVAWTLDERRLFGLLWRADQDTPKAMDAWQTLADVGQ